MKLMLLPVLFFSLVSFIIAQERIKIEPLNPKVTDEITVIFNSEGTILENAEQIKLFVYSFNNDLTKTREFELTKKNNVWSAAFSPDKEDAGALLLFKNNELIDNNSKKGYYILYYGDDNKLVPGSKAGLANAINTWGTYYLEIDKDPDTSLKLFNEEFASNPSVKKEFFNQYFSLLSRSFKETSDNIIRSSLNELELTKDLTEEDLVTLADWNNRIQDTVKSNQYRKILDEKYPLNKLVQLDDYKSISKEKNIKSRIDKILSFEKKYPGSDYIPGLYDGALLYYRDKKEYAELKNYMVQYKDKINIFRFNSIASKIVDDSGDLNIALDIAKMGIEKGREEVNNPSEEKPNYSSEQEWMQSRKSSLGYCLMSYGKILNVLSRNDEAVPVLKEAVGLLESKEAEANQLYVKALFEKGNYDSALEEGKIFIKEGNSTAILKEKMEMAYKKKYNKTEGFNEYIEPFEKAAKEKLIAELKNIMINEKAPDFKAADLSGKEISLSTLKGKVVILDFWATWCGPCRSSFPGMKKAVEKFSTDDNVKFFFVNSWENVEDKKKNAEDFINNNNYPFQVLMDMDNKVIESYKVSGIPTKFIIDREGNIRFKSIGYSGNNDKMVEEIETMISLLGHEL